MRSFLAGVLVLTAAVLGLRLWVSSREWFISDDFYFLRYVQSSAWSWQEVFLPTSERLIGAYRPLGLETYYFLNFKLFGLNAFGYYAVGLAVQLVTACVIYRIARQLELSRASGTVAAVLVVACAPSVVGIYCACVHNYLLAALFYSLAVSLLFDYLRTRRARFQLGSCAALVVGLLCNDVCMTMPVVAVAAAARQHGLRLEREPWVETVKTAWPHAVVAFLFLDFRIDGVPLRQEGWFYEIDLGPDMISNSWGNLAHLAGGGVQLVALIVVLGALTVWTLHRDRDPESARALAERVGRSWILTVSWLLATLLPFAVLAFPDPRFALALAPPAALTLCALLDALLPDVRVQRWPALAWLVLIAMAVPWRAAYERAEQPESAVYRRNFALLTEELRNSPPSALQVEILYGAPGLADPSQADRFQWDTFNGALVLAAVPEIEVDVAFRKVSSTSWIGRPCHTCERFYLQPDRALTVKP